MKKSMGVTPREYTPPKGKKPAHEITVKVKREFLDRYTGIKRKPGDTFAVTESRYLEIKRSGDFVEAVKEAAEPAEPAEAAE